MRTRQIPTTCVDRKADRPKARQTASGGSYVASTWLLFDAGGDLFRYECRASRVRKSRTGPSNRAPGHKD